ncbi:MAG: ATP-binding protein, partial [Blastocatellia bacterium]|nr:ATP-binding protein [Blastocatellia bacterium]
LRKIYKDMFHWGETNKLRFAIVLDEAHRLSKDITLPKIMKEGRKFGILVITASQGLGDFHQDVVDNVGSRIIFRTNYPISRKIAKSLKISKSIDLATEIEQLDVGYAYVKTPEMSVPQKVKMFNGLY